MDKIKGLHYSSAKTIGNTPIILYIYVHDVDNFFSRAPGLGATIENHPTNRLYGDRMGTITDPFGFKWNIAEKINPPDKIAEYHNNKTSKSVRIALLSSTIKFYKRKYVNYKKN